MVGSGPNGLAAAIELARAGWSVTVHEAEQTIGGGARTEELTLPGFRHDLCSAIHPLAVASPFFRSLPLDHYGLEWIHPTVPLAHPLDGDRAAVLQRSLDATADALAADGPAYRRLFGPLVEAGEDLFDEVLGPIRVPRHPVDLARFGVLALRSAQGLATDRFVGESARGRAGVARRGVGLGGGWAEGAGAVATGDATAGGIVRLP